MMMMIMMMMIMGTKIKDDDGTVSTNIDKLKKKKMHIPARHLVFAMVNSRLMSLQTFFQTTSAKVPRKVKKTSKPTKLVKIQRRHFGKSRCKCVKAAAE